MKPPREAFKPSDLEFEFREFRRLIGHVVKDYLSKEPVVTISSLMVANCRRVPKKLKRLRVVLG